MARIEWRSRVNLTMRRSTTLAAFTIVLNSAFAAPMEFNTYIGTPSCPGCILIEADGEIASDTSRLFEDYIIDLEENFGKDTTVIFNSPGGNLNSGLEIGKVIRANGFNTHIARIEESQDGGIILINGICASACAYAFLGGERRSIEHGSTYGLHQFSTQSDTPLPLSQAIRATQDILAKISAYIERMGAAAEISTIATRTGEESVYWLSSGDLSTLRIVNSKGLAQQPAWERAAGSLSWSVYSLLPNGERDLLIMSCNSLPSRINTAGHVRFNLRLPISLPRNHTDYRSFATIPTQVYLGDRLVFDVHEQLYMFDPPGHGTYPIELPASVLRSAIQDRSSLTIKIYYPDEYREFFSMADHPIPREGLDIAIKHLTSYCQHLNM